MKEKIGELQRGAEAAGRDPAAITIALGASVQFTAGLEGSGRHLFTGRPDQVVETIKRYQDIGVQDFRIDFPSPSPEAMLGAMERFATDVRPHVMA
jgi:alkanesulfonate monooxygenase SsuD/methylene tetrahydromethanopterin reductase-like flavin-dependent oxidoreductase (luciferase family)